MRTGYFFILPALLLSIPLFASDRTALLIANSNYAEHPLPAEKANIAKLSKALEQAGFSVTVKDSHRERSVSPQNTSGRPNTGAFAAMFFQSVQALSVSGPGGGA